MRRTADQKIVLVMRETRLAGLRKKFATASQAKFAMKRARRIELDEVVRAAPAAERATAERLAEAEAARPFDELAREDAHYEETIEHLTRELDLRDMGLPLQRVDREFVPNLVFGPSDIVVTVGQDGLVANVAKYAVGLPIIAVNPDPQRIDGVLLPFRPEEARGAVLAVLKGRAAYREVTLAQATLTDGQRLLAFNDLFIGSRTHVSARYHIRTRNAGEPHSSSGVIVATGAGSTGWLSSVFNMAAGVASAFSNRHAEPGPAEVRGPALRWEDPRLVFVVREPFLSKSSRADIVAGVLDPGDELILESLMPSGGVIFSDGVENDFLDFNSGATARVRTADARARLVTAATG